MTPTDNNVLSILSRREMGNPLAQKQLSRWYSRLITTNIEEERYNQITIKFPRTLISYDRKNQYVATFTGRKVGYDGLVTDCAVDFWDIATPKKLWSHPLEDTDLDKGKLYITDSFRVVFPQKYPENSILILSKDKQTKEIKKTCIDIPELNAQSTRVIGNRIAARTNTAFFVWDTDGRILWSQPFPDNQVFNSEKIACNQKYYVSQLGQYSHSDALFRSFHGTSRFFVADLGRCKASFCRFDLAFYSGTIVSALSVHADALYIASYEFQKIEGAYCYANQKIQTIDLYDLKPVSSFSFEPLHGYIRFMISTSSQLICIKDYKNEEQIEILSSDLSAKEKSLAFLGDNMRLEYGKYSAFNSGYCSTGSQPVELASIPDGTKLEFLNLFNDFTDGVFVSFDSVHLNPKRMFIKNYNRADKHSTNKIQLFRPDTTQAITTFFHRT